MSIRLDRPFRASVAGVRAALHERERPLFDLLCAAGQLCYSLPHDDISLRHVSGARDPRKRLAREFPHLWRGPGGGAPDRKFWSRIGGRLARRLLRELSARGSGKDRPLRVLLAYAPGSLAPDGRIPGDDVLRAAWDAVVRVFADLFPSTVRRIGPLRCVDAVRLAVLKRETTAGLRKGRPASGQRAGPEGRRLAVDPHLMALAGRALGKKVAPGYQARYLFYSRPGDHFWPHPDDPTYAAQLLLCIEHVHPPRASSGSAFLAYRAGGSVKRYELAPGEALIVSPGRVHGREPMRRGERLVMLSIGLGVGP